MARDVNLTSQAWCELVFEGKNKNYGAYVLRQKSSDRHLKALMIVVLSIAIAISGTKMANAITSGEKDTKETYREVVVMKTLDLTPPKEEMNVEVKVQERPKIKSMIAFTEPKITHEATDDDKGMETQDDLNKSTAIIGPQEIEGDDDLNGVNPKELDNLTAVTGGTTTTPATVFEVAEVMPAFPGGDKELLRFLSDNLRYPVVDMEGGTQGRVVLRFVVGEDGRIRDISVLRSLSATTDKEAMRVVKSMPKWIPGRQNGKAVPVFFSLPVRFKLET